MLETTNLMIKPYCLIHRSWIRRLLTALPLLGCLPAAAVDRYWSSTNGGTYTTGGNWAGGTVPGTADRAFFTSNASYQVNWSLGRTNLSAFFNAASGSVTQSVNSHVWQLTNFYLLGQSAGQNPRVTHSSGTLRVANTAGSAVLEVRRGTNFLNGGVVEADVLRLTNNLGQWVFNGGTLITRSATLANGSTFRLGVGGSTPAVWAVRAGGENRLTGTLQLGVAVPQSALLVTNGGKLFTSTALLGNGSASNLVFLSGAGSSWSNNTFVDLGVNPGGHSTRLVLSNGAALNNSSTFIGSLSVCPSNSVLVTGAGSVWTNRADVVVGNDAAWNQLVISNGGRLFTTTASAIGAAVTASNNVATIIGLNSLWSNSASLAVGNSGAGNRLELLAQGQVAAPGLTVGAAASSTNNRVRIEGGGLFITNAAGTAAYDLRRGTNVLTGGLTADSLRMTNSAAFFEFPSGLLRLRQATVSTGRPFLVGNGVDFAQLLPVGVASLVFADGITFINRGIFDGSASIGGVVDLQSGSRFALAQSSATGRVVLTNAPLLGGRLFFELAKAGGARTNDVLQVLAPLTYGGALEVTHLGPDALALGDRFVLFAAPEFAGSFSTLLLPELPPGLMWTNKLLLDGSLEVVEGPPGDRFWTNLAGGTYHTAGNWLAGLVPRPQDNAHFSSNATYQVSWAADASVAEALFGAGSGTVTQALGAFVWQVTNRYVLGLETNQLPSVRHLDGTLRVTNTARTATLEVRRGTNRVSGGVVEVDRLLATNSAGRFFLDGGTLLTRGANLNNGIRLTLGATGTVAATWDVRAGEPTRVLPGLDVGGAVPGCALLVTNGGVLTTSSTRIGLNSSSNLMLFANPGTLWTNTAFFDVGSGEFSTFNQLVISNGAAAVAGLLCAVGQGSFAHFNLAVVTGPGSQLRTGRGFSVGQAGRDNRLLVSDGAAVFSGGFAGEVSAVIGDGGFAQGNEARIIGAGSVWSNSAALQVGRNGAGNHLSIEDGGTVLANGLQLSAGSGFANRLTIANGSLVVTNAEGMAALGGRSGTIQLQGGTLLADLLRLDGLFASFEFNGGALTNRFLWSDAEEGFIVGRTGPVPATWHLRGAPTGMAIPTLGAAQPYPSVATLSGLTGSISRVRVTLAGLSHTFPGDLDILLVSPEGEAVMLMSDAGGGTDLLSATLVFDDDAPSGLPTTAITDGTYKPTNYGASDALPAPAPALSTTNLASFHGGDPNGDWLLFVADDQGVDGGALPDWRLEVQTTAGEVAEVTDRPQFSRVAARVVVGDEVPDCQLVLTEPGGWLQAPGLILGQTETSTGNRLVVANSRLELTNATRTAVLELRRGTNQFDSGEITADVLVITNAHAAFDFNGGTLDVRAATVAHGRASAVGDGSRAARLRLLGDGAHLFADGLTVRSNATLTGSGSLTGVLTVASGGVLAPGASVGRIFLHHSPLLAGTVRMELSKAGGTRTNDVLRVAAPLTYGGALDVIHLGPDALALGDRFPLFNAPGFSGAFSSLALPTLPPGLVWTNKLLLDGSLEIIPAAPPAPPMFTSVTVAGGQLVLAGSGGTPGGPYLVLASTNAALPVAHWIPVVTNSFDGVGEFHLLLPYDPATPARFYRLSLFQNP